MVVRTKINLLKNLSQIRNLAVSIRRKIAKGAMQLAREVKQGFLLCAVTPWSISRDRRGLFSILIHLEGGDKGFLRNFDLAELPHLLLAFLLLVEKLPLARDVAAIAFGGHVLAHCR